MDIGSHISLKAEEIFHLGDWKITNTYLLTVLVVALFFVIGTVFKKKINLIPGKLQSFFEILIEKMLDLMEDVLGNRFLAEKYLPLVASLFLFILFSNWLGLLPGISSLGVKEGEKIVPFLRSPASDLNFTLALALGAILAINIFAFKSLGFKVHLKKFLNFENPIKFFVGILELVSELAKVISFSFRLFGNVFAGEVLLLIVGFLVPYIVPVPFLFMEFFVGFIQAFIFAMLSLVFISIATAHMEH